MTETPFKYLPGRYAESLRNLGLTVRRPVSGTQQGLHRSLHFGSSVEFAEYRDYSPGDPLSLIDWSVYARTDRYMIRQFREETNVRAVIAVDTSNSMFYRDEGPVTKIDYACSLAAGIMVVLVNQGDAAALAAFDADIRAMYPPAATFEGLRTSLEGLETLEASGRSHVENALHELADRLKHRSLVIVISDFLQEPGDIHRGLRHLSHDGHSMLLLHVLDHGERQLSFAGITELRDVETGERMLVEADEIRDTYRSAVDGYIHRLRRGSMIAGADYHLLDTRTPPATALRELQGHEVSLGVMG